MEYHKNLQALGNSAVNKPFYEKEGVDATVLECFPSPFKSADIDVLGMLHIECPEFTSLCPLTGQPDFATIVIDYVPGEKCVESKSLKLYIGSFRNHGGFHEECVTRIASDLIALLNPVWIRVKGRFTPRGGIPFHPTVIKGVLPQRFENDI